MTVSLIPAISFAAPEGESTRPSIVNPVEAGENYTGGIDAIDWGDTDWGAFKDVDWTDAENKTADELAAMLESADINVLNLGDETLVFGDTEGESGLTENLGGITTEGEVIKFPEGDMALITSSDADIWLQSDAEISIPDNSSVLIINVSQENESSSIFGGNLTINTNNSGNLAAVNLHAAESSYGIIADSLSICGGGVVAAVSGKAPTDSAGIFAYSSISVNKAALIGTCSTRDAQRCAGIVIQDQSSDILSANCVLSAEDGAIVIGAGGESSLLSRGILTDSISAKNGSEIYAYGGNVPPDDGDPDNDMRTIGLEIMEGTNKRKITVDNGSAIYARAGNGEYGYGISEYYHNYGEEDASNIEYGGVEFVVDESENAEPSEIIAAGNNDAYHQRRVYDVGISKTQYKDPTGNVTVMGSRKTDGRNAIVTYFNSREHKYMYAYHTSVDYVKITRGEAADYYLVYKPDEGALYKNNGEKLESFPGTICEGDTLTLTNDFHFETNCGIGLYLFSGTTLAVPEGVTASVMSGDDPDNMSSAALVYNGGCNLEIDGLFTATGRSARTGSSGILGGGGTLSISGKGKLYATGGDVIDASAPNVISAGISSDGNISIRGTAVRAYSRYVSLKPQEEETEPPNGVSVGMFVDNVFAGDGADVHAEGEGGGENVMTYGCIAKDVTSEGSNFGAYVIEDSYCDLSAGLALKQNGKSLSAFDGGKIDCESLNYASAESFGLCEQDLAEENGPVLIIVDGDESAIKFLGVGAAVKLPNEPVGSYTVKGSQTDGSVTFDKEQAGYVRSDGSVDYMVEFTTTPTADYGIYYDAEAGFRKNTADGEVLTDGEIPKGMSADGSVLTLDNVVFESSSSAALIIGEGVTVKVPEGKTSGLGASPTAESEMTFALVGEGGNTLEIDGGLLAAAYGFGDSATNVAGIFSYGDMTIKGSGDVSAYEKNGTGYSYGMMSNKNFIFDGEVNVSAFSVAPEVRENNSPICGVAAEGIEMKGRSHLDTSRCENSKAIMIMNGGNIIAEDDSFIEAEGGIVIYGIDEQFPGSVTTEDNAIISAHAERLNFADTTDDDDAPGILAWIYDDETKTFEDGKATITVKNNSSVTATGQGSAVWGVSASDGVTVTGSTGDYDGEVEYDGFTYVIPGTDTPAESVTFTDATQPGDHMLYFDGETSKLYTGYNYDTGELGNPIEVPGAACDGKTLTLTSDFKFFTNYADGLHLSPGTTLYVPAGESPEIYSAYSGVDKMEAVNGAVALYCSGDNTLKIDGNLTVTAGNVRNTNSYAIAGYGIKINGGGMLLAGGGDAIYDETLGGVDENADGYSCGIISYTDMTVSGTTVVAYAGDAFSGSVGLSLDIPTRLTLDSSAYVTAVSNVDGDHMGIGCNVHNLEIKDNSKLEAFAVSSGTKQAMGLLVYHDEQGKYGEIKLSNNSSIKVSATGSYAKSYGVGSFEAENSTINISMDSSSTFTAEGGTAASKYAMFGGVKTMSDGTEVSYNEEKQTYVDVNGDDVKKISVEPLQTSSSTSRGSGSGRGRAASTPTASPQPTVTPAPEASASPEPTSTPTAEPQSTSKPDGTEKTLPFTDVAETDWFCDDVKNVYESGLMSGVSDTRFEPDTTLTRGMLAAILGRIEGVPEASGATEYTDVDADEYYAPYIAWGSENGILSGFGDGTFHPNDPVTREQTAKIIKAYYDYKGKGPTGAWAIRLDYADLAEISDWAAEGVMFCTMKGIMVGRGDEFDPKTYITRAECAAVIGRIK